MAETHDTLSLYFGLHEGRKADLEIVSRAAIEWVNSVRHASKIIEPTSEIRIKFINAHESSLSINNVIEWGQSGLAWGEGKLEGWQSLPYPLLRNLLLFSLLLVAIDAKPAYESWFGTEELSITELSDKDLATLKELSEKLAKSEEIQESNKKFFNILGHDSAISSVGLCQAPSEAPVVIVPSSEFAERSGIWDQEQDTIERIRDKRISVVLEIANLTKQDLKWRFRDLETYEPFKAKMRDEEFIKRLATGTLGETLRNGIQMEVVVQFREGIVDGEWVEIPTSYEILTVIL